jgi:hypothetical protein
MNHLRALIAWSLHKVTGVPRYFPPIEWSSRSWTHNLFRAWEYLAGAPMARGEGGAWSSIGRGAAVMTYREQVNPWILGKQVTVYQFFTAEAVIAHAEGVVRSYVATAIKKARKAWKKPRRLSRLSFLLSGWALGLSAVMVPATAGGAPLPIPDSPYRLAIAYSATSTIQSNASTSSLSVAFSVSGSNTLMTCGHRVYRNPDNTGTLSANTYNSVAFTDSGAGARTANQNNCRVYLRYLVNPSSGSNTLSCTYTNSATNGVMLAVLYTGCKQTGQPDSFNSGAGGASSLTASTTVVATGCWLSLAMASMAGADSVVAGTGTTERGSTGSPDGFFGDSNGTVGTGSQSMSVTMTLDNYGFIIMSIAPAASGPAGVKEFDGVTQSTGIKEYFGIAVASVKAVNDIT